MDDNTKRKTIIYTLISIFILLAVVVGATYAYFIASGYANRTSGVNVITRPVDSISCTNTALSITVAASDMKQANGTAAGAVAKTATSTITCTATKGSNDSSTDKCTMNVKYTPTKVFTRSANNTSSKKELTLSVSAAGTNATLANNTMSETDMTTYSTASTAYNLINGLSWQFTANSTLTITFTAKMYNYNFDQSDLAGKTLATGSLATTNMSCAYQ